MKYSVSNSEAVERALGRLYHDDPIPEIVWSDGRTVKSALDELQAKVDEQAAYIEQVEASYSQMMRSLDEVHAEVKGT